MPPNIPSVVDCRSIEKPSPEELLVIVGPTASGKTDLAIRLAQTFGGEIISADSIQIYREFNIGSGKPTPGEKALAPHHLIDVCDPRVPIEANTFAELAQEQIRNVRERGNVPILCGGTFLWVKAVVWGLAKMPDADPTIRNEHARLAEQFGRAALHAELQRIDPSSAARLAPNDFVRVSRALEVFRVSGRTMSDLQLEHGFREQKHRARLISPFRERPELDERIAKRTECWLAQGWIDEVNHLVSLGYETTRPMGSVGYRDVFAHIRGEINEADLATTIVRSTRVFVRRQRTWLRDLPITYVSMK